MAAKILELVWERDCFKLVTQPEMRQGVQEML